MTSPAKVSDPTVVWAAAVRAAGATLTLGYLLGVAPGPLVAVVGGLALITFGRALTTTRHDAAFLCAALAILAGVLGVAALRWGALDLGGIRGVQAFFGPTLLVEPVTAAAASWVAAVCGVIATGLWLGPRPATRLGLGAWIGEGLLGCFAIVTAFWGEGIVGWGSWSGELWADIGRWALSIFVAGVVAICIAMTGARLAPRWRWIALGISGAAVLAAASVTAAAVRGVV